MRFREVMIIIKVHQKRNLLSSLRIKRTIVTFDTFEIMKGADPNQAFLLLLYVYLNETNLFLGIVSKHQWRIFYIKHSSPRI